jgi:hypothetical protein
MSQRRTSIAELDALVAAAIDGRLTEPDHARLAELLEKDDGSREYYVEHVVLHAMLGWEHAPPLDAAEPIGNQQHPVPPIVLDLSPTVRESLSTSLFSPGGFLFSYVMATAILGIGLLIGLGWKVSRYRQIAQGDSPTVLPLNRPEVKSEVVGSITGMADCQWVDPATKVSDRDSVPLGHKFALARGLLEISYHSGAKVILQGPAAYEVNSRTGGFLSFGRLTALVEKNDSGFSVHGLNADAGSAVELPNQSAALGAKGERTANPSLSASQPKVGRETGPAVSLAPRPYPPSTTRHPLFAVHTPTAVVTDLGTEFGVEVDKSGTSRAHVFQGRVELRSADGDAGDGRAVELAVGESARVQRGADQIIAVTRAPAREGARFRTFARRMPRRIPMQLFNTGMGLKPGDADPHWRIVAVSNDPRFKPRPAVVTRIDMSKMNTSQIDRELSPYLAENPARSQWVSTADGMPSVPNGVTYTFRTTFELADMTPGSAFLHNPTSILMCGQVKAIRLNGRRVMMELDANGAPQWRADQKFVEGTNALEIDLQSGNPAQPGTASPVLLRVELSGSYVSGYRPSPRMEEKP